MVCKCFGITDAQIIRAIRENGLKTVEEITNYTKAGGACKNLEAFETIIRFMHDKGVGYGSINHPLDRDPVCGYVGVINGQCPRCGRKEGEAVSQETLKMLRRKYPHMPNCCR